MAGTAPGRGAGVNRTRPRFTPRLCTLRLLLLLTLAACGADDVVRVDSADLRLTRGRAGITVVAPQFLLKLQQGSPFGVVLLESAAQPQSFVHPELPLADWEWLWVHEDGETSPGKRIKLIEPSWPDPEVTQTEEGFHVVFTRQTSLAGADLALSVSYDITSQGFEVEYGVRNLARETVPVPYMMVGFPGFTYPRRVNRVALDDAERSPRDPLANFHQEIVEDGRAEKTLLERNWEEADSLRSRVTMLAYGERYAVEVSSLPGPDVVAATTRHVIKPAYLTSHLYVTYADLPPDESRRIRVRYRVTDSSATRASTAQ